ncbi:MAG: zinc ribbon domain-containing protein [Planctomycetota bacterium]
MSPPPVESLPRADESLPSTGANACPACGSPQEVGDRFCPGCGREQAAAAAVVEGEPRQRHFHCNNCGAEVSVDFEHRSYTCPFCESTYVVEFDPAQSGRQRPEFVIGFAVTHEQAQDRFRKWLGDNQWFRPGDLKAAEVVERLRGVYLPFWSFSMLAESRWRASIGEHWYRTETYTVIVKGKPETRTRRVQETEWWPLSGEHHEYYSGFLVSGSRGLTQADALRIMPFHLPALKRYAPYFLAGWLSEEYSVDRTSALQTCQQEFYRREQNAVAAHLPGDTYSKLQVDTRFSQVNSDLVLLPVYLLSYRYQERVYRFLMNGQTGRVAGDKPLSYTRIGSAVGVAVAVIAAILVLIFLLSR